MHQPGCGPPLPSLPATHRRRCCRGACHAWRCTPWWLWREGAVQHVQLAGAIGEARAERRLAQGLVGGNVGASGSLACEVLGTQSYATDQLTLQAARCRRIRQRGRRRGAGEVGSGPRDVWMGGGGGGWVCRTPRRSTRACARPSALQSRQRRAMRTRCGAQLQQQHGERGQRNTRGHPHRG